MSRPSPDALIEHAEFLRALAFGLLRNADAADDAVQSTFVEAIRRPPENGNFRAWLATVVRNISVSRLRSDRRRAQRERAAARPESCGDIPETVTRLEVQRRVVAAVLALDPIYRDAVLARYYHGDTLGEAARRLNVPIATARTRLRRAVVQLRSRLDDGSERADASALFLLTVLPPGRRVATVGGVVMSGKSKLALASLVLLLITGATVLSRHAKHAPERRVSAAVRSSEGHASDAHERLPAAVPPSDVVITGRCLDLVTGAPVVGAVVSFGASTMTTVADGRFRLVWAVGENTPVVHATKEGFAIAQAVVPSGRADMDVGILRLRRLQRLRGKVVLPDGGPAADASVRLLNGGRQGVVCAAVKADKAGRFTFSVPDEVALRGPARGPDYIAVSAYRVGLLAGYEDATDLDAEVIVMLGSGRRVSGVVLDEDAGEPIEGATLRIAMHARRERGWLAGVTAADGSFAITMYPKPTGGRIYPVLSGYSAALQFVVLFGLVSPTISA